MVGLAALVEGLFHPAPFVHLMLWIPTVIILALALLRPFKGVLISLQYRHKAEEVRPQ